MSILVFDAKTGTPWKKAVETTLKQVSPCAVQMPTESSANGYRKFVNSTTQDHIVFVHCEDSQVNIWTELCSKYVPEFSIIVCRSGGHATLPKGVSYEKLYACDWSAPEFSEAATSDCHMRLGHLVTGLLKGSLLPQYLRRTEFDALDEFSVVCQARLACIDVSQVTDDGKLGAALRQMGWTRMTEMERDTVRRTTADAANSAWTILCKEGRESILREARSCSGGLENVVRAALDSSSGGLEQVAHAYLEVAKRKRA